MGTAKGARQCFSGEATDKREPSCLETFLGGFFTAPRGALVTCLYDSWVLTKALNYTAALRSGTNKNRTAHSFDCSGLLASLAPSAALTRSLARSLRSLPRSWESEFFLSQNDLVLSHSGSVFLGARDIDFIGSKQS